MPKTDLSNSIETVVDQLIVLGEDKKATDIRAYNVADSSPITDFIIVMSVGNRIHSKALVADIEKQTKVLLQDDQSDNFYDQPKVIGRIESGWMIVDLNSIVVHVLEAQVREQFALDELFASRSVVYHY